MASWAVQTTLATNYCKIERNDQDHRGPLLERKGALPADPDFLEQEVFFLEKFPASTRVRRSFIPRGKIFRVDVDFVRDRERGFSICR